MVMSPMRKVPRETAAPAITVMIARPVVRISDWTAFSRLSELFALTATST